MKTIVNFGHPLPEGRVDVTQVLGDEYRVVTIPVQVDQATPLLPQAKALADQALAVAGGMPDAVVLPGLAAVAVCLDRYLHQPQVLRLAPVAGATPPRFEAVELL